MAGRASRVRGRLTTAVVASGALVLSAPFAGVARSQLQRTFPARFAVIVYGVIGALVLSALGAGVLRVRSHRLGRVFVLAATALVAAAYVVWTGSHDPAIRAVEAFHFVEYGAITFLFYLVWRDAGDASALVLPAMAAFAAGIAEEAYQWFLPARVGELRDVWLNGVAIACGLAASVALSPPPEADWTAGTTRRASRMLSAVIVALAAFVHLVHLGVDIHDGDVSFVSRYTAAELASEDAARQARWRASPPLVRPDRLSREDQFATEGLQHVQARNERWAGGDPAGAWAENAILERYYPSVLDTPSYVSKTGHRWAPEQRREAESRAAPHRRFTSTAYPYPIFTWPPALMWSVALAAAALLWLAGGRAAR